MKPILFTCKGEIDHSFLADGSRAGTGADAQLGGKMPVIRLKLREERFSAKQALHDFSFSCNTPTRKITLSAPRELDPDIEPATHQPLLTRCAARSISPEKVRRLSPAPSPRGFHRLWLQNPRESRCRPDRLSRSSTGRRRI